MRSNVCVADANFAAAAAVCRPADVVTTTEGLFDIGYALS